MKKSEDFDILNHRKTNGKRFPMIDSNFILVIDSNEKKFPMFSSMY